MDFGVLGKVFRFIPELVETVAVVPGAVCFKRIPRLMVGPWELQRA